MWQKGLCTGRALFAFMSVVDLNAGTSAIVALDFSGRFEAGQRVGAHALVVQGNM